MTASAHLLFCFAARAFRAMPLCLLIVPLFAPSISSAGTPPPGWQVTAFGRSGTLATNAIVDYDAGTWNVKTGPTRSALVVQNINGDAVIQMKIEDASGQPAARIGIMMWSSLSLTAGKAGVVLDPQGQKIAFTWDESSDSSQLYSSYLQNEGIGFPVWLRLTRSGSYFAAHYSRDGKEWRPIGVPVKTFWAGRGPDLIGGIYGEGVCEQRISNLAITKSAPSLAPAVPANWTVNVHGQPDYVGDARFENGRWTLSGASPRGRVGFHNVTAMQPVASRVQLTARVRTANLADPRSSGGLILNALNVDAGVTAQPAAGKLTFFTRRSTDGRFLKIHSVSMPSALIGQGEVFLRLAVVDANVAGFFSSDNKDWKQIGNVLAVTEFASDLTGGFELNNDSSSRSITTVSFENVEIEPITALPLRTQPVSPTQVAASRQQTAQAAPATPQAQAQSQSQSRQQFPTASKSSRIIGKLIGVLFFALFWLGIIAVLMIPSFNRLVYLRNRTRKAWSQIDVQLKRRHDLILNFVEAVKGYAKHEKGTLEGVTQARSAAVNATTVGERAKAEAALNSTMHSLYAVVESYPELKADQNFRSLQDNLKDTEDRLAHARHEYNEEVLHYNTKVQSFPSNVIAFIFRFKERDFFELKETDQRETPKAAL
jgi:Uncharacterized conserved protein